MEQEAKEERRPSKVTRVAPSNVRVRVKQEVEDRYVFVIVIIILFLSIRKT